MSDFGIGASVRRKEDFRFLTGRGTYTDDIDRPGQLHAFLYCVLPPTISCAHTGRVKGFRSSPMPSSNTVASTPTKFMR
jgi:CO/xanthine dehydrogenase Mo-binding subunit